jgi:hydroxypyruvate isomerase
MTSSAEPAVEPRPLRQVLTRVPFGAEVGVEELCAIGERLGAVGIDAISDPADWPTLERHGLVCSLMRIDYGGGKSSMLPPAGPEGWGQIALAAAGGEFLDGCLEGIDLAANHRIENIVLYCGSRLDVSSEQGAENAVAFLDKVKRRAEDRGVTLNVEILNSVGQFAPPEHIFDHMEWGLGVVKRVNSPRVKILYDIFHVQLMDGNIVDTFRDNLQWIGHIHVGGVPGRGPLDDTQELNFGFIGRAIAESGYTGFVGHEWSPPAGADPVEAVRRSMAILDGRE